MRPFVVSLALVLAGCTQPVAVETAPPMDVYSVYADKVPGTWLIAIENDDMKTTVTFPSEICSIYDFPVDLTANVQDSGLNSFRAVADDVRKADAKGHDAPQGAATGIIRVHIGNLQTAVRPLKQGWNAFDMQVTLDAQLTVESGGKRILDAEATGSGASQSDAGAMCDDADTLVANAATEAVRQTLRPLAEKFANAREVREARPARQ